MRHLPLAAVVIITAGKEQVRSRPFSMSREANKPFAGKANLHLGFLWSLTQGKCFAVTQIHHHTSCRYQREKKIVVKSVGSIRRLGNVFPPSHYYIFPLYLRLMSVSTCLTYGYNHWNHNKALETEPCSFLSNQMARIRYSDDSFRGLWCKTIPKSQPDPSFTMLACRKKVFLAHGASR